jgi:methylphosphotriester-DNA--protein-cysteine methyltransferase
MTEGNGFCFGESMKRPKWSALLARPVTVRDGPLLRTLKQAADLTMQNGVQRSSWESAAQKLITAAESVSKADIEAATKQIELALFVENRLQMKTERNIQKQ